MASVKLKYESNIEGNIYVDNTCINCDLCRAEVPEVFKAHEDGYSYVYAQPKSPEIYEKTIEVIGNCPVEAIGNTAEEA